MRREPESSGTSLLRSPKGLVILILRLPYYPGLTQLSCFTIGSYLGLSHGDRTSEVVALK